MSKRIKNDKGKGKNILRDSSCLFCIIMISGLLLTAFAIFLSHGRLFSHVFFNDRIDTGMDFFHSIEYTYGRSPYAYWHTIYPPLANLFFYLLFRCVPPDVSAQWAKSFLEGIAARGTDADLRVSQSTMMLFILFIISSILILNSLIKKYLSGNARAELIGISVTFSYGMLYAFERGNIIILSLLCTMFFVFFRHSANKYIRELALILLAVAAGLKMYPAVFGILLLYDREYARASRTVLYGVLFFILPCFAFVEGLGGIRLMFEEISRFTVQDGLPIDGYSADRILNTIVLFMTDIFSASVDKELIKNIGTIFNLLFPCVILLCGFMIKSEWKRTLICSMAMLLYSSQGIYATIFLVIPMLVFLHDEPVIHADNVFGYALLVMLLVMLPVIDISIKHIPLKYIRYQLGMVVLTGYIIGAALKKFIKGREKNNYEERKLCHKQ